MARETKVSVFMGISLDGFIARIDGNLDFLDFVSDEGEDYGYKKFMESIDCILMGRITFEKVLTFDEFPYSKPVLVYSNNIEIPKVLSKKVEKISGEPKEVLVKLVQKGFNSIYLDGGITVSNFLKENLVDEIILTRVPYLLGKGIPLFHEWISETGLHHEYTREYPSGLVQSKYRINSEMDI